GLSSMLTLFRFDFVIPRRSMNGAPPMHDCFAHFVRLASLSSSGAPPVSTEWLTDSSASGWLGPTLARSSLKRSALANQSRLQRRPCHKVERPLLPLECSRHSCSGRPMNWKTTRMTIAANHVGYENSQRCLFFRTPKLLSMTPQSRCGNPWMLSGNPGYV